MSPPLETPAPPSGVEHLARVHALAPLIAASSDEIERARRLPQPLVVALKEADLFRMLLPREYGGAEIDPLQFLAIIETIAKHDASTAWILCQTSVAAMIAARLPPATAREMWREPGAVLSWGPGTDARAVQVEGGYRLTGTYAFASGCWYATWLGADCTICGADGAPLKGADGKPETRRLFFPAERATMRDIWNVIGLRGTGSDGYVIKDLFVPRDFSVARIDDPSERRSTGRLFALSCYNLFASGFSALSLGIARSLLDNLVTVANEKTPRGFKTQLRFDGPTQLEIGHAEARLRSARMYLMGTVAGAWAEAQRDNDLTLDARMSIRLAATYVIHQAKSVADTAYELAGTTAVFAANPFERRFRDIHTLAQQLQGRRSHLQTVGQYLLGLDPELGWL